MNTVENQIIPNIIVQETIKEEVQIPEVKYSRFKAGHGRKNNRKNTKGRNTQYITVMDDSVFPPKFSVKCIKHSHN